MSGDDTFLEEIDENANKQPTTTKPHNNYELARKFQLEWACKQAWDEGILINNGKLHMVRCNAHVYSTLDKIDAT